MVLEFLKDNIWLVGCILGLIIIVLFMILNDTTKEIVVKKTGEWLLPPIVINCQDSPYTTEEVENAVKFWEELGYETLGVIDDIDCPDRRRGINYSCKIA